MPLPSSHIKQRLNVAYVSGVAVRAGAAFQENQANDFGLDGYIQEVSELPNGILCNMGWLFHCQLKATTTCRIEADFVVYDMEVDAYNKLVQFQGGVCILVLFCLHEEEIEWLTCTEEQFTLKRCCYWEQVQGQVSLNARTVRIRIPRQQVFTPEAVVQILDEIRQGVRV